MVPMGGGVIPKEKVVQYPKSASGGAVPSAGMADHRQPAARPAEQIYHGNLFLKAGVMAAVQDNIVRVKSEIHGRASIDTDRFKKRENVGPNRL